MRHGVLIRALPSHQVPPRWTIPFAHRAFLCGKFPYLRDFPYTLNLLAYPIRTLKPFTPMYLLVSGASFRNLADS